MIRKSQKKSLNCARKREQKTHQYVFIKMHRNAEREKQSKLL